MDVMLIALISVLGSGLLGITGVLVHFLLKQGAGQREHADRLHGEAMDAIAKQGAEQREHADRLHGEAMDAIAKHGERMVDLHLQAMAAVAALGERTAAPEAKAGWRYPQRFRRPSSRRADEGRASWTWSRWWPAVFASRQRGLDW